MEYTIFEILLDIDVVTTVNTNIMSDNKIVFSISGDRAVTCETFQVYKYCIFF